MRTIKFKAKRLDNKEWTCGYFYEENDNTYIIEDCQKESMLNRNITYKVDPNTVYQFTGLLDSTGREIYEGDTLSFPSTQYIVNGISVRKQCYIRVVFDQGAFCAFDEIEQRISRPLGSYDKTVTSVWKVICNSSE